MKKGVQKIFSEVANTYELVNHVLTFGLDIYWRKKAARQAAKADGLYWLDVCSGTGEMAQNLALRADEKVKIISVDFCYQMLIKAAERKGEAKIFFAEADAKHLPFPEETFDLVTISFATRNINPRQEFLSSHLREFHRLLKPGGRFVNLETSQPRSRLLRKLFHFYIKLTVKPIGSLLSGSKAGYSYLSYTIPRFYPS
ncbi:MAG: ubiquinone/menaquinone biosynthesis methyltransferase, partial [Candidatus Hydrothermarchaeales archaeon]